MLATTTLVQAAALLPALALAAPGSSRFDLASLSLREVGARNTLDWRVWLEKDGNPISFWHDVPLYPDESDKTIVRYYVEIPRWTDAKIETKRDEPLNPIFHDEKDDKPRFVESVWPHRSYPFNYGSVPQTWENPEVKHEFTGYPGDKDPVDMFDISSLEPGRVGQVKHVKILGGLAMIDDDATDWKMMAIDVEDPLAALVDSVEDLETYRPGLAQAFYDWFVYYKVPRGKETNTIVGGSYVNATLAAAVVEESHGFWRDLMRGKAEGKNTSRDQTANPKWCKTFVASEAAGEAFGIPAESRIEPPAERPRAYDQWYYLTDEFALIELPGQ